MRGFGLFIFRRGKGDKDVKKEFKKTSPQVLDFSKKKLLRKILKLNARGWTKLT
jgi:hypothetical protein